MSMRSILAIAAVLLFLPVAPVWAQTTRVAVLEFELNDLTLQPNTPEEVERTASLKPLLQDALARKGFDVVAVNSAVQEQADAGFGYLFDHHAEAARLGRDVGAAAVVVGRLHKASFLFVYLKARLVDATTGQLLGDLVVEIKGPQRRMTARGVESLAQQIAVLLEETAKAGPAG